MDVVAVTNCGNSSFAAFVPETSFYVISYANSEAITLSAEAKWEL